MDISGRSPITPEGDYFRANIWSWRPLHQLCETVLQKEYPDWGYNDGQGFTTQAECDDLADKLEAYLKKFPKEQIEIESELRVEENGRFLPPGTPPTQGRSPYYTSREHVQKFVTFLRGCGGFEIW